VGLSFSAGMYEAICFLALGKIFAEFQTGNLVYLGFGVAGARPPASQNPVTVIISLAAFAAGVALAVPILKAPTAARRQKTTTSASSRRGRGRRR
jgi:uncharacterized membrane protein YoaK (UPF0700 family)